MSRALLAAAWVVVGAAVASAGLGVAQPLLPHHSVRITVADDLAYGITQSSVDAALAELPVSARRQYTLQVLAGPMPSDERRGRAEIDADAVLRITAPVETVPSKGSPRATRGEAVARDRAANPSRVSSGELMGYPVESVLEKNLDAGHGPYAVVAAARRLTEVGPGHAWEVPDGWLTLAAGLGSAGGALLLAGWPRRGERQARRRLAGNAPSGSPGRVDALTADPQDPRALRSALPLLLTEILARWERVPHGLTGLNEDDLGRQRTELRHTIIAVSEWAAAQPPTRLRSELARRTERTLEPFEERLRTIRRSLGTGAAALDRDDAAAAVVPSEHAGTGAKDADPRALDDAEVVDSPRSRELLGTLQRLVGETRSLLGTMPVDLSLPRRERPRARALRSTRPATKIPSAGAKGPVATLLASSWKPLLAAGIGAVALFPALMMVPGSLDPAEEKGRSGLERVIVDGGGTELSEESIRSVAKGRNFERPQTLVVHVDEATAPAQRAATEVIALRGDQATRRYSAVEVPLASGNLPTQLAAVRAAHPELFDPATGELHRDVLVVGFMRLETGDLLHSVTASGVVYPTEFGKVPGTEYHDEGRIYRPEDASGVLGSLWRNQAEASARSEEPVVPVPLAATGWVVFGSTTALSLAALVRWAPGPGRSAGSGGGAGAGGSAGTLGAKPTPSGRIRRSSPR